MTRHHGPLLAATLAVLVAAPGGHAQEVRPLSSIDWLSNSLDTTAPPRPERRPVRGQAGGAGIVAVTVTPLGAPAPDGVGLTAPEEVGLAPGLWGASTTDDLARRISDLPEQPLPAARDALKRILLARLDPPMGGGTPGALLTARVDALLRMGALNDAQILLERAGPLRPELFRRAFDIALLLGEEDAGCATLDASPGIAPSISTRIFCLARRGDWPAAALTLDTAEALGQLTAVEDTLLARFLDAEIAEDALLPIPRMPAPTPLQWRMLEAIGERQPTAPLPLAFGHADLRSASGWRARLEATERLVRAGALPPQHLADVYAERAPAASGGLWDRVAAVQSLDRALETGAPRPIGRALSDAWAEMTSAGLGPAFAEVIAPRLADTDLPRSSADLALRIALLSSDYEAAALSNFDSVDPQARAFAMGLPPDAADVPEAPLSRALAAAFSGTAAPSPRLARLQAEGKLGEALIVALTTVAAGASADPADLTGALVFLRTIGMEDTARRAALQLYLLESGA
ncbi:MAG: hypothetical protein AAFR47_05410 [Pseudomonadota bacterium]